MLLLWQLGGVLMKYYPRLVDKRIDQLNEAFYAINIFGPKGCGKTSTAK